jgi:RNA polymerase sigma factor (sigma-70 family)
MKSDSELLREYVRARSEEAFRDLVSRYTDLAFSAALRETNGDAHIAKDVTQAVFVSVARKAAALVGHTSIAGWIYTSVRYEARNIGRANRRRQNHEQEAHTMNQLLQSSGEEADWTQLMPVLDDGMHSLNDSDRHAIVLRFFERRRFGEVAQILGLSEDAARKRIERAIERLRVVLTKSGVPLSVAGLAEALEANAVAAAPVGIAAAISGAAAGIVPTASLTLPIFKAMILSKTNVAAGLCLAALSGGLVMQTRQANKLRSENEALRQQPTQIESAPTENAGANTTKPSADSEEHRELLRLRGEVGVLRTKLASANAPKNAEKKLPQDVLWEEKPENQESIRRMNHAQGVMLGFFNYASEHDGELPTNFSQAAESVSSALKSNSRGADADLPTNDLYQAATNRFEIVYRGRLEQARDPATIVLREKEAWQAPDGTWHRTYGFGDGHTEIHRAPNGDFEPWEQAHMQKAAGQAAAARQ